MHVCRECMLRRAAVGGYGSWYPLSGMMICALLQSVCGIFLWSACHVWCPAARAACPVHQGCIDLLAGLGFLLPAPVCPPSLTAGLGEACGCVHPGRGSDACQLQGEAGLHSARSVPYSGVIGIAMRWTLFFSPCHWEGMFVRVAHVPCWRICLVSLTVLLYFPHFNHGLMIYPPVCLLACLPSRPLASSPTLLPAGPARQQPQHRHDDC